MNIASKYMPLIVAGVIATGATQATAQTAPRSYGECVVQEINQSPGSKLLLNLDFQNNGRLTRGIRNHCAERFLSSNP